MAETLYVNKVLDKAYHRNAISGVGFSVVLFEHNDVDGGKEPPLTMLAILFPNDGECAVLDVKEAAAGNIKAMGNSWRGDVFEAELRDAIKDFYPLSDKEYSLLNAIKCANLYELRPVPSIEDFAILEDNDLVKAGYEDGSLVIKITEKGLRAVRAYQDRHNG